MACERREECEDKNEMGGKRRKMSIVNVVRHRDLDVVIESGGEEMHRTGLEDVRGGDPFFLTFLKDMGRDETVKAKL